MTNQPKSVRVLRVAGIGVLDIPMQENGKTKPSYRAWVGLLHKVYNHIKYNHLPKYADCAIHESWHRYSNFAKFHDKNYRIGYVITTKVFGHGSTVYGPDTCCYVPKALAKALQNYENDSGLLPGVSWSSRHNTFVAMLHSDRRVRAVGTSNTEKGAHALYIKARADYIREIARSYYKERAISAKIRDALLLLASTELVASVTYLKKANKSKLKREGGSLVLGVGITDVPTKINRIMLPAYTAWTNILTRCYCKVWKSKHQTYETCRVSNSWKRFSNFKAWFDANHIDGYDIDKDICSRGSKIYSARTCNFIPQEINKLFVNTAPLRGDLPRGVSKHGNVYIARVTMCGRRIEHRFDTVKKAHNAYLKLKADHIVATAHSYFERGAISKRVYKALLLRARDKYFD